MKSDSRSRQIHDDLESERIGPGVRNSAVCQHSETEESSAEQPDLESEHPTLEPVSEYEHDRIICQYEREKVLDADRDKKAREKLILGLELAHEEKGENGSESGRQARIERLKVEIRKIEEERKEKQKEEKGNLSRKQRQIVEESKEKDKQEYENFMRKQKQKAEQRKEDKQEDELVAGYAGGRSKPASVPTYVKIHLSHLDTETLHYYNIPYEYDTNPEYIIMLREMSEEETETLFEHARRLRTTNRPSRVFPDLRIPPFSDKEDEFEKTIEFKARRRPSERTRKERERQRKAEKALEGDHIATGEGTT